MAAYFKRKEKRHYGIQRISQHEVYEQSGYNYKATPTIMLKGQWLKDCGFDMGTPITVKCEGGKLTITRADEIIVDYGIITENPPESKVAESTVN